MRCGGLRADSWFRAVAVRIVRDGSRFVPESEAAVRRFACDATLSATICRGLRILFVAQSCIGLVKPSYKIKGGKVAVDIGSGEEDR